MNMLNFLLYLILALIFYIVDYKLCDFVLDLVSLFICLYAQCVCWDLDEKKGKRKLKA